MLDISGWLPCDPRHDLLAGLETPVGELHGRYDDCLVFGENGCELQMPLFPLFHYAAGLPAEHHFHRYCRTAYHLRFGAPGGGSSGVHELGRNPYVRPAVDHPAIPTLAVVHDTLLDQVWEVAAVVEVARQWAGRWCP